MFVCGSQVGPPSGLKNKTRLLVGSEVFQPSCAAFRKNTGALSNRKWYLKIYSVILHSFQKWRVKIVLLNSLKCIKFYLKCIRNIREHRFSFHLAVALTWQSWDRNTMKLVILIGNLVWGETSSYPCPTAFHNNAPTWHECRISPERNQFSCWRESTTPMTNRPRYRFPQNLSLIWNGHLKTKLQKWCFVRKGCRNIMNASTPAQTGSLEKQPHIGNTGWWESKIPSFWRNAII